MRKRTPATPSVSEYEPAGLMLNAVHMMDRESECIAEQL
jgi:hypothetical protein